MVSKVTQKLRKKILSEMIMTTKEKSIRELMDKGKIYGWTERQIRIRWNELEKDKSPETEKKK